MTEAGEPVVTLNECDRVNNHFVRRKDVSPTVRHYRAKYGIVRHKDRGQIVSIGFLMLRANILFSGTEIFRVLHLI